MNKFLIILTVLLMLFTVLVSCTNGSSDPLVGSDTVNETAEKESGTHTEEQGDGSTPEQTKPVGSEQIPETTEEAVTSAPATTETPVGGNGSVNLPKVEF